jgi:hypothetical protein
MRNRLLQTCSRILPAVFLIVSGMAIDSPPRARFPQPGWRQRTLEKPRRTENSETSLGGPASACEIASASPQRLPMSITMAIRIFSSPLFVQGTFYSRMMDAELHRCHLVAGLGLIAHHQTTSNGDVLGATVRVRCGKQI